MSARLRPVPAEAPCSSTFDRTPSPSWWTGVYNTRFMRPGTLRLSNKNPIAKRWLLLACVLLVLALATLPAARDASSSASTAMPRDTRYPAAPRRSCWIMRRGLPCGEWTPTRSFDEAVSNNRRRVTLCAPSRLVCYRKGAHSCARTIVR